MDQADRRSFPHAEELAALKARDFRAELPFLDWREHGGVPYGLTPEGELGTRLVSGEVASPDDPRLADFNGLCDLLIHEYLWQCGQGLRLAVESMADPNDDAHFTYDAIAAKPDVLSWLAGNNPSYRPTRPEIMLRGAYAVRQMRKNRVVPLRTAPTGDEVSLHNSAAVEDGERADASSSRRRITGGEGWSREMTKTEAGRLLGCVGDDRTCRDHLTAMLDGRTDVVHSRTPRKHRFDLAWVRGIEPTAVDSFKPRSSD